jgi:molecular chaperone GrpE
VTKKDELDAVSEEQDPARSPAEPGEAAAAPDPEELARQRDDYYDRLLRKTAEFDNYRKRTERERREFAETAAADLITDLLPLVDNLERALKAEAGGVEGAEAYRQGVELIHRQLMDLLRRRGVRPVETAGARFDPHVHEAVAYEPWPGHEDGEIIEEFTRGYMLGDRLLRPAIVKVAKA